MAHKTIMVQEDVYELLSLLKGADRSFNDLLKDLVQRSGDIRPFFGTFNDECAQQMLEAVNDLKNRTDHQKLTSVADAWVD